MHQDACRDMEKENEITWLVVLSLTVIQHHGPNHMCSNRDKNRHICTPHTDRYAVVQWQVLGRRLLSILIACVFWQDNFKTGHCLPTSAFLYSLNDHSNASLMTWETHLFSFITVWCMCLYLCAYLSFVFKCRITYTNGNFQRSSTV